MPDQRYAEADVELLAPVLQKALTKTFTDTDGHLSLAFADGEELAPTALDALAAARRLLPEDAEITEEWGVLELVSGGCNFTMLDDSEGNGGVDREQWAREFAAREGGEVQCRTVTHAESDWLPADAAPQDSSWPVDG